MAEGSCSLRGTQEAERDRKGPGQDIAFPLPSDNAMNLLMDQYTGSELPWPGYNHQSHSQRTRPSTHKALWGRETSYPGHHGIQHRDGKEIR